MQKRYVSIWFRRLLTDWQQIRCPELKDLPFVFAATDHGRNMITAVNHLAAARGIKTGMKAADAKAICPNLEVLDDKPGRAVALLKALGIWCIRYAPIVMIDDFSVDGLFMDVSGCTHLWAGEREYLKEIVSRLKRKGYTVRLAIADNPGAAWAISRFGTVSPLIPQGKYIEALLTLPPEALRLEEPTLVKLRKLGFYQIKSFIGMPRSVLRRRFGEDFLARLGQALGTVDEILQPVQIPVQFQERLPCLEPIRTRSAIEIAISKLLENLCLHLKNEGKGLRTAILTCYRVDGKIVQIDIGTNGPAHSVNHLFKILQHKN
jgi:protein ImuB